MRLLPALVLAGLPCAAVAQGTLPDVQKAAQSAPAASLSAAELGLPNDDSAAKTAALAVSRGAEATTSDFDTDKIAGNEPIAASLAQRSKAAGTLPDPAPSVSDLGTGPEGAKIAVLDASKTTDGRTSTYDTDKIDGNPEVFPPLAARQKAPGMAPEGATEADFGLPADAAAPKTADLAVFHADGTSTDYDEDKIDGNGESAGTGPLSDRQKRPSELAMGADPTTFGQPVIDAAKEADLGVSKAEIAVANLEDNDKIAGNAFVAAPLFPRQKAPSAPADPVADAEMGQPAIDAPKVDLAVSKQADGRQNVNDNDKIDGNPIVALPLAERSKSPAYEPAIVGLSDAELGLPAAPEAAKTAEVSESKSQGAVASEYDEDKIAGNSYQDPAFGDDYLTDSYDSAPPPELVAQVRAQLDDPATRVAILASAAEGGMAPEPVAASFQSFVGTLFDVPQMRDRMAEDIAAVFDDFGFAPDNPAAVGRMAAEFISSIGEAEASYGTVRRSVDEQRAYLADALRIADALPAQQCALYLDGSMDSVQQRRLTLSAIAGWPEAERNAMLAKRAAAIIAELQNDPPAVPMPDADAQAARQAIGTAALAIIDAAENGPALIAAFGDPYNASPAEHCAVQKLIIGAALASSGQDADLAVRYLVEYGWQN